MAQPSYKPEKPRRATGRCSHDVLKLRRAGRLDYDWIADPTPRIRKPASRSAREEVEVIRFYGEHLSGAEPAVGSSVTTQAAAYIGSTPGVMLNWRSQRRGPRYHGKNDFVRYRDFRSRSMDVLPGRRDTSPGINCRFGANGWVE